MVADVLDHDAIGHGPPGQEATPAPRRRRVRVWLFLPVFLIVAGVALAYIWSRPPVYQASGRLLIDWGGGAEAPDPTEQGRQFLTQCEVLTSRPLLEKVVPRLGYLGEAGGDPVTALQAMLVAEPVEGTRVVILRAEGSERLLLSKLVNAVVEEYQSDLAAERAATVSTEGDALRRQLAGLEEEIAAKREAVAGLGERYDIVSIQRDENLALARLKGLQESLNKLAEAEVNAKANLKSVEGAIERGEPVVRTQDQRAIADLKRRAADLSEQWTELENKYPPKRLELEPSAGLLRRKLERVKEQLAQETEASQEAARAEAVQALDGAREARRRIERQVAEQDAKVKEFSRRFQEYEAASTDLENLETLYQERRQGLVRLEVVGQVVHATAEVLEEATVPERPIRPHYWAESAAAVGSATLLGLLTVWLVEFLARPQPAPGPNGGGGLVPLLEMLVRRRPESLPHQPVPLLGGAGEFPRELTAAEIATLIAASKPPVDVLIAGLLSGLGAEEMAALTWGQVDLQTGRVTVDGPTARTVPLAGPVRLLFKQAHAAFGDETDGPLRSHDGASPQVADLDGLLACTAHDAGLVHGEEVTSDALRHTFLAHLVRRGARLSEVPRLIGPISPPLLAAYGRLAPSGPGIPLDEIDLTPPGF
jgi:uncharacterized protein involved in exopolysaccharide biosynthesis